MQNQSDKIQIATYLIYGLAFLSLISTVLGLGNAGLGMHLDGHWRYTLKFLPEQGEALGESIFFTYGPLYSYVASVPVISTNIIDNILPVIFGLFTYSLLFYLLYKITKFKPWGLIFLIAFIPFMRFGRAFGDAIFQVILLFLVFAVDKNKIKINCKSIVAMGCFAAIMLLYKFSSGLAVAGVAGLLIFCNSLENYKKLAKNILIYVASFFLVFFVLFFVFTKDINFLPFILNSLSISGLYKEYMAIGKVVGIKALASLLLVIGLLFPLFVLKKKNYLPYIYISYIAFLYGWIRFDMHVLATNIFILAALLLFIFYYFRKENKKKFVLWLSICFLLVDIAFFLKIGVFDFGLDVLEKPVWKINYAYDQAQTELQALEEQIPESVKNNFSENSCLMVVPDASAIPLALNKCQIHTAYTQMYSNYPNNSDELNIKKLKQAYPQVDVLMHSGTLNNRIYMSESPLFMLNILKNFELRVSESSMLLLKPKNSSWEDVVCEKNDSDYNLVKIRVRKSLLEKIALTFFKGKDICLSSGGEEKRTFYSQLENGLLLEPFIWNSSDDLERYLSGEEVKLGDFEVVECSGYEMELLGEELFACH